MFCIFFFLYIFFFFFFNDTATTEIYTLSLHDALPISRTSRRRCGRSCRRTPRSPACSSRSEEHTSELQSRQYLVCRLLLEKKKNFANTAMVLITNERLDLTESTSSVLEVVDSLVFAAAMTSIGTITLGTLIVFFLMIRRPPSATLFPYTTLFR